MFLEETDRGLVAALEAADDGPLVRQRGFLHVIDSDPSRINLPPRSLPVYLLAGRDNRGSTFERQLRRMTMLEELRRSGIRQLVVIAAKGVPPAGVEELWTTGFRTRLVVVDDAEDAASRLDRWLNSYGEGPTAAVVALPLAAFAARLVEAFHAARGDDRLTVRQRDQAGSMRLVDLSDADDRDRPILDSYDLILDRDLSVSELGEEEFNAFFRGDARNWRAFAADLPWFRNDEAWLRLQDQLSRLDVVGSPENRVCYIMSEPGAGGTTLARHLAFNAARAGYPALVAKGLPFTPEALPLVNFLTRAKQRSENTRAANGLPDEFTEDDPRIYETPWVIVFDRVHWEFRNAELRRFLQQLERAGRPACIVVVTGPQREMGYYDTSRFKLLGELHHMLDEREALELGRHLNRFLREYGKERPDWQWRNFQEAHSVRLLEGIAAFWITLSFWLQAQYDLSEFDPRMDIPCLQEVCGNP